MPKTDPVVIEDAGMIALIEQIVRWHRASALRHERAGRHALAQQEFTKVSLIEAYLPEGARRRVRTPG